MQPNLAAALTRGQSWLKRAIKKEKNNHERCGNHEWDRVVGWLNADQPVGDDADNAANQRGVDDVPLAPENAAEDDEADDEA